MRTADEDELFLNNYLVSLNLSNCDHSLCPSPAADRRSGLGVRPFEPVPEVERLGVPGGDI